MAALYCGAVAIPLDIVRLRLHNQLLIRPFSGKPEDVVKHLVAIQAQDFSGALWAVGLRLRDATEPQIEAAFAKGQILRTHVLRPTWHFVSREDIRWLLKLTAPRVHAQNAHMYRQNDLDAKTFKRAHAAIEKALGAHKTLTRNELKTHLAKRGIATTNLSMAYIMMHAELEGLICSGPRRGKQFTYALLDERSPDQIARFDRQDAATRFVQRFITARGPATAQDFSYWSGLTVADANAAIDKVKGNLNRLEKDGKTYWYSEQDVAPRKTPPTAYLLPNFDEYGMSYKDHGFSLDKERREQLFDYAYSHLIVINGLLAGSWRRIRATRTPTPRRTWRRRAASSARRGPRASA